MHRASAGLKFIREKAALIHRWFWLSGRRWKRDFRTWTRRLRGLDYWLWPLVLIAMLGAVVIITARGGDVASVVISVAILLITAMTFRFIVPQRAELSIERQHELGLNDLIFYVYPQPAQPGQAQIPRDFLLQLHVAVINIGGKKAVLSSLALSEFQDNGGRAMQLRDVPMPIQAHQVVTRRYWTLQGLAQELQEVPPPYLLEPDDVLTLRFRGRFGIDWTAKWSLEAIHQLATSLETPIAQAKLVATYRRGIELVTRDFVVDLFVQQQQLYGAQLRSLTLNFTTLPNVPQQPITP